MGDDTGKGLEPKKLIDLFGKYRVPMIHKKGSERGEYLEYFYLNLLRDWKNKKPLNIKYVAFRLTGFTLPDLRYLKSICEDYERRGFPFSKCFWGSIKTGDFKFAIKERKK